MKSSASVAASVVACVMIERGSVSLMARSSTCASVSPLARFFRSSRTRSKIMMVSLTVVAAILTLLGYSANDTIIIFDRVREDLKKRAKGESLPQVLDRAINETLPRSVMTHATVLASTLALLFIAGEVIRPFAWVMTFGVFVATFSSIYVAGPFLIWIESKYPRTTSDSTSRSVNAGNDNSDDTRPRKSERLATR